MIKMKRLSEEVYVVDEPVSHFGKSDIDFLKENVQRTQRKRTRICAHKDNEAMLHEMFVCYVKETYVRPNKHIKKDESLHIIEGEADFIFFDDAGNVTDVVPLGDYKSGRKFYCRIRESVLHTFVIKSDKIVIHESIPGPFRRDTTEFASWGPEESDIPGVKKFMADLAKRVSGSRKEIVPRLKRVSDAVYQAEDRIVSFSNKDVRLLNEQIDKTGVKRIRICAHKNTDDLLQEMIISFSKGNYIRPSKHIGKEESIHILEGKGEFVLFDESGNITESVPVGDPSTGREMYVRTPESRYHMLMIQSDRFVVQETTQGPFKRSDTVFAEWAPEDGSPDVPKFLADVTAKIVRSGRK